MRAVLTITVCVRVQSLANLGINESAIQDIIKEVDKVRRGVVMQQQGAGHVSGDKGGAGGGAQNKVRLGPRVQWGRHDTAGHPFVSSSNALILIA